MRKYTHALETDAPLEDESRLCALYRYTTKAEFSTNCVPPSVFESKEEKHVEHDLI